MQTSLALPGGPAACCLGLGSSWEMAGEVGRSGSPARLGRAGVRAAPGLGSSGGRALELWPSVSLRPRLGPGSGRTGDELFRGAAKALAKVPPCSSVV